MNIENGKNGRKVGASRLPEFFAGLRTGGIGPERLGFLCIGTDCSSGDAFGPLAGTLLAEAGMANVTGTLERPCDAASLTDRLKELRSDLVIVAVDACLGRPGSAGMFLVSSQSVEPGRSLGLKLPAVGHYSVLGIVAENTAHPYRALQTASLHRVLTMARQLVAAVQAAYPGGR